jgi:hypothetical protein
MAVTFLKEGREGEKRERELEKNELFLHFRK